LETGTPEHEIRESISSALEHERREYELEHYLHMQLAQQIGVPWSDSYAKLRAVFEPGQKHLDEERLKARELRSSQLQTMVDEELKQGLSIPGNSVFDLVAPLDLPPGMSQNELKEFLKDHPSMAKFVRGGDVCPFTLQMVNLGNPENPHEWPEELQDELANRVAKADTLENADRSFEILTERARELRIQQPGAFRDLPPATAFAEGYEELLHQTARAFVEDISFKTGPDPNAPKNEEEEDFFLDATRDFENNENEIIDYEQEEKKMADENDLFEVQSDGDNAEENDLGMDEEDLEDEDEDEEEDDEDDDNDDDDDGEEGDEDEDEDDEDDEDEDEDDDLHETRHNSLSTRGLEDDHLKTHNLKKKKKEVSHDDDEEDLDFDADENPEDEVKLVENRKKQKGNEEIQKTLEKLQKFKK